MVSVSDRNPQHHTEKMKTRLQETVTHLREDIQKVDIALGPKSAKRFAATAVGRMLGEIN
jgi:hypothetical protein